MWLLRWINQSVSRNRPVSLFLLTYTAYATLYATRKPFSVVKTRVQDELHLSTHWLGVIDTCFLGSYALGQIFLPTFLARCHMTSDSLLLILYLGSGFTATLFGMSTQATTLAILWAINGVLHSAVFPLLIACVVPQFPASKRGQVMGTWTTSQQLGATLATIFSAFVSEMAGWRAVFILPGIFTMVFGLFLKYSLGDSIEEGSPTQRIVTATSSKDLSSKNSSPLRPEIELTNPDWQNESDLESATPKDGLPAGTSFVDLMKIRDIKFVSLSYFCVKCIRYSLLFWLPYYLATELGYSADVAGYASITFDLGGILGGLLVGQVADRLCSGRRLMVAAYSCTGSALALAAFALSAHHSTVVALSLMALVGFTVAGADSIIGGSAASDLCDRAEVSKSLHSATSGIVNGCGSVGAVAQGYLTAHISETYGWLPLYTTLAATALIGGTCLIVPSVHERAARLHF